MQATGLPPVDSVRSPRLHRTRSGPDLRVGWECRSRNLEPGQNHCFEQNVELRSDPRADQVLHSAGPRCNQSLPPLARIQPTRCIARPAQPQHDRSGAYPYNVHRPCRCQTAWLFRPRLWRRAVSAELLCRHAFLVVNRAFGVDAVFPAHGVLYPE